MKQAARLRGIGGTPALPLAVLIALVAGASLLLLSHVFRKEAVEDGSATVERVSETIETWFARYSALAPIYARDPRVIAAMEQSRAPGDLRALNLELEAWNRLAGSSDTYVMAPDGTTLAASNWNGEVSFVGRNFAYRPYFKNAMAGEPAEFFGLGTTSGLRGYYFSAPIVGEGDAILGVLVVKITIDALERTLRDTAHPVFVTDEAGIIILSGNPALRLTALGEIDETDRARIEETRKFALSAVTPAPIEPAGSWLGGEYPVVRAPAPNASQDQRSYLHLSRALPSRDWRLHLLYDATGLNRQFWTAALALAAAAIAISALIALALQRRRRLIERLGERERARDALERRVALRTADLTRANERLEAEVAERRAAEAELRRTQSELIQAGKLAALGQMSAGLSHEFNQPLTAIRSYSENAIAFFEAGRGDRAAENLGRVLRLTERMAQLSKHLTRFARRSPDGVSPVTVGPVIAEALALLSARIERAEARVTVEGRTDMQVFGGAVRLQHVVMNLVGNALDASPSGPPVIAIRLEPRGEEVAMIVEDNGHGIPDAALDSIFDPFFTTKDVGKGLGLGLSISYNIVRDFGGTMQAENRSEGGARMIVTLRRAEASAQEAAE
ncbi:ATP-binding protein [Tropicimonas sp. IMCC34011]|uniref:sensor histidine kinase n=1 Tax=Tropicimonas sp. IMCC34011 TaxID=2248759 RepID=UPI000E247C2F|nr:ATP-binding protein [Tropicimonas sp. IMCC34011]